ncbi:MAG TPA: ABC transporter permease [Candidatus Acidoferrum sp.]|jgi:predicted permease
MPLPDFLSRKRKQKRALTSQLDSELRFHIDELTQANISAGMSTDEARRQATLEFGGRAQIREELYDVHRLPFLETAFSNLKSALRFIRKSPAFSAAVILTLALGIGANSAVFSAIDAILLRPLPYPDGDQIVKLEQSNPKIKSPQTFVAPLRVEDWNRLNSTFQALTGYYTEDASETSGALPEKITEALVAPRFLQVWGIYPAIGRDFSPAESQPGGPPAVLISDRLWRDHFHSDPHILEKHVRMGTFSPAIVGVMPASFLFPVREVDVWYVIPANAGNRSSTWYTVIGRLKPGVTINQARANLASIQSQLGKQYPLTDADLAIGIDPLKELTIAGVRNSLWILFGSVSLLLIIACTNIVALLLARDSQRRHEIAVRFSLGASRSTLIGQLLTESFVLALAGAALGLAVAAAASRVFRALAADLPRVEEIHLNTSIVLYSLLCSVIATLLCGLLPAIRSTRTNLSGSLAQSSRTQVSGRRPLQWLLVGVQVALAVTLLAGAGLLLRSFQALGRISPGFDASRVLSFHVSASWAETADMKGLTQRIDRTIDALATIPGVESSAIAASLPGIPDHSQTELKVLEGEVDPQHKIVAESRFVSPGYFATMRIPLLAGDLCRESADPGNLNILVNRNFADTFLSQSTSIGHHLQVSEKAFPLMGEIRGIVADARENGINREPGPIVYWCTSSPVPDPFYLVRSSIAPTAVVGTIREKLHEIEPSRSVFAIAPLQDQLDDTFAEDRLRTVLLTFFALTAISLACVGLYGTLNYSVTLRRREVALRLALGASQKQVLKQFLLQGFGVASAGCAAGAILTVAFAIVFRHILSNLLYSISPTDVTTLSTVIAIVLTVAAASSLIPAHRASRTQPMRILREE